MQLVIKGHGLDVTETLRDYAQKKIIKIEHFFENIQRVEVKLEYRDVRDVDKSQIAQVTVWASGKILRAEEDSADMYSSIDLVFSKLEHQIVKYKEKLIKERRRESVKLEKESALGGLEPKTLSGPVIVKTKRFALKPMPPEEAAEQIELLGHDFFMFLNSETNEVNVIYRRKSGNYGLIEPEI